MNTSELRQHLEVLRHMLKELNEDREAVIADIDKTEKELKKGMLIK